MPSLASVLVATRSIRLARADISPLDGLPVMVIPPQLVQLNSGNVMHPGTDTGTSLYACQGTSAGERLQGEGGHARKRRTRHDGGTLGVQMRFGKNFCSAAVRALFLCSRALGSK